MRELIIDNFAGGGGASTGVELALGRPVDIAINHDEDAISMHQINHPRTKHYCESVWDIDPIKVTRGHSVALAWFSPDCTHFSKAKGGRPLKKEVRGLAWVAVEWAKAVKPRVIMLENVEEFKTWGPLDDKGYPQKELVGETFKEFVDALRAEGYTVEHKELRACDYGAPTTRKRLFLIARCDNKPIVWAKPTHGDPDLPEVLCGELKPYVAASTIIDWTVPTKSIFGRKKPLAEATLERIARGIERYVIDNEDPHLITSSQDVISPSIMVNTTNNIGSDVRSPLKTITTGNHHYIVSAFISKYYGGYYQGAGSSLKDPLDTITTIDHNALCAVNVQSSSSDKVDSFLTKYYGNGDNVLSIDSPLHTITTKDRFGLVTLPGNKVGKISDIGLRMLEPRELFNGQGFPKDYIIEFGSNGKRLTKTQQKAKCGNSVPPAFSEALVRANFPEYAHRGIIESMRDLNVVTYQNKSNVL